MTYQLKEEYFHNNGIIIGEYTSYLVNGQIFQKYYCIDGKKYGLYVSYYLNDTYATFFKDLIDCKIVFSDPTECANHLNTILDDPNKWWLSQKVRINRNKFLKKNYKSPEAALNFYENFDSWY